MSRTDKFRGFCRHRFILMLVDLVKDDVTRSSFGKPPPIINYTQQTIAHRSVYINMHTPNFLRSDDEFTALGDFLSALRQKFERTK